MTSHQSAGPLVAVALALHATLAASEVEAGPLHHFNDHPEIQMWSYPAG
jgi:hypothetical protein